MRISGKTSIAFVTLAVAALSGCALTPPAAESALERARTAFRAAQTDPHVTSLAPTELTQASGALNHAEQLARQGADGEEIAHAAYLAMRQAQVARHHAMARAAEAELHRADATRNRVIVEARAREADAARAQAEKARAEALARASAAERAWAESVEAREQAQRKLSADITRLRSELTRLQARETERGWVLGLGSEMLFDTGQSTLKPGAQRALERVAHFMREYPDREVAVEGFTDSTGADAFNQQLSEDRAHAVRRALIEHGVPAKRIAARGHGEGFPVATNATAAGRQMNRRVEIVIASELPGQASAGR